MTCIYAAPLHSGTWDPASKPRRTPWRPSRSASPRRCSPTPPPTNKTTNGDIITQLAIHTTHNNNSFKLGTYKMSDGRVVIWISLLLFGLGKNKQTMIKNKEITASNKKVLTYSPSAASVKGQKESVGTTSRDKNWYTTTNKCLQCLLKIMYTVFEIIGVYVWRY